MHSSSTPSCAQKSISQYVRRPHQVSFLVKRRRRRGATVHNSCVRSQLASFVAATGDNDDGGKLYPRARWRWRRRASPSPLAIAAAAARRRVAAEARARAVVRARAACQSRPSSRLRVRDARRLIESCAPQYSHHYHQQLTFRRSMAESGIKKETAAGQSATLSVNDIYYRVGGIDEMNFRVFITSFSDYVYFENFPSTPYYIRRIEELNKVNCFNLHSTTLRLLDSQRHRRGEGRLPLPSS